MNKKLILLLIIFHVLISFSSAFGQSTGLFEEFNGRSRKWIERNYPDYKIMPDYNEAYDGYYWIESLRCENDGYIILMVGFDGYKNPDEVGTVSLYAKECKEYIPNNDINEAADFFIQMFGLSKYIDDAKVFINDAANILVQFPDLISFSAHKRYNAKSGFYYFYSSCSQPYPSK